MAGRQRLFCDLLFSARRERPWLRMQSCSWIGRMNWGMALKWGSMADGWDDIVDCRGATNWWNGWLKTNWPWEGDAYVAGCSLKNDNSPCCACMSKFGLLTSSLRPPRAGWLSVCRASALSAAVETWSRRDSLLLGALAAFNARSAFNYAASSRSSAFARATSSRLWPSKSSRFVVVKSTWLLKSFNFLGLTISNFFFGWLPTTKSK